MGLNSAFKGLKKVTVKWSRYRPGVAQRVGRGIALLFHDSGTRRGWVVSSTPRPHFTLGRDPVPILQEAGWAPGPVWTGGKSRPHRDSIPDRPACNQSLYRLSYPVHKAVNYISNKYGQMHTYITEAQLYYHSFYWPCCCSVLVVPPKDDLLRAETCRSDIQCFKSGVLVMQLCICRHVFYIVMLMLGYERHKANNSFVEPGDRAEHVFEHKYTRPPTLR